MHPNWNADHATVKWKDTAVAKEIKLLANGRVRSIPPDGVQWLPADKLWIGGELLKAWKARLAAPSVKPRRLLPPPKATLRINPEVSLSTWEWLGAVQSYTLPYREP
jgi:hypothetical protein